MTAELEAKLYAAVLYALTGTDYIVAELGSENRAWLAERIVSEIRDRGLITEPSSK